MPRQRKAPTIGLNTRVDPNLYLPLRDKLRRQNIYFKDWLEQQIRNELQPQHKNPGPQRQNITPIHKFSEDDA
jgi:hypothetical protein